MCVCVCVCDVLQVIYDCINNWKDQTLAFWYRKREKQSERGLKCRHIWMFCSPYKHMSKTEKLTYSQLSYFSLATENETQTGDSVLFSERRPQFTTLFYYPSCWREEREWEKKKALSQCESDFTAQPGQTKKICLHTHTQIKNPFACPDFVPQTHTHGEACC